MNLVGGRWVWNGANEGGDENQLPYGCMFQSFHVMILEKLRQEIPVESLWSPSAEGKKTAKDKPKLCP